MPNCYEQMKNTFVTMLNEKCGDLTADQIRRVTATLDMAAVPYEVKEAETALSVLDGGVPDLVKTYIAVKKVEGLSKETLKVKFYRLRSFLQTVRKPLNMIGANDIRAYLYQYQEQSGVSNATLDGVRIVIDSFFRWAACEGYLDKDPSITIKPVKYEKKQRCSLTQLELEYIRRACGTAREKAMIEFFYSTGCRVSEMCAVKLEDVDFISGEVTLFGKGSKYRTSYINAKAAVAIRDYLNERGKDASEYLFCTERRPYRKLTKAAIEKAVRDIMARVPEVKKHVTPHIFRHTTATQAVNNGMPIEEVQRLLGHAKVDTTMIYVESDQAKVKASHVRAVV